MKISVIEKSRKEVEIDCYKWAKEIEKDFEPECVIFIANSGFLFAKAISEEMQLPLGFVKAVRSGESTKNKLGYIKKIIPKWAVKIAISSPFKFYIHSKRRERNIEIPESLKKRIKHGIKKVLLVDDSVDTGWTIKQVYENLSKEFGGIEIRTAAYSVSQYSKKVFSVDYYRKWNELVITATSRKSYEYQDYINELHKWMKTDSLYLGDI